MSKPTLGQQIAAARIAAGLTTRELAEKMGTGQAFICRLENDSHEPKLSTLKRIAEATGAELGWPTLRPVKVDKNGFPIT